jgi:hypothetical protein
MKKPTEGIIPFFQSIAFQGMLRLLVKREATRLEKDLLNYKLTMYLVGEKIIRIDIYRKRD